MNKKTLITLMTLGTIGISSMANAIQYQAPTGSYSTTCIYDSNTIPALGVHGSMFTAVCSTGNASPPMATQYDLANCGQNCSCTNLNGSLNCH